MDSSVEPWEFSCFGRTKEAWGGGVQAPFFHNPTSSFPRSNAVCSPGLATLFKASRLRVASVAASLADRRLVVQTRSHALLFQRLLSQQQHLLPGTTRRLVRRQ